MVFSCMSAKSNDEWTGMSEMRHTTHDTGARCWGGPYRAGVLMSALARSRIWSAALMR